MPETAAAPATTTPIVVTRLGHVVYEVSDIERTTRFWTELLGFTVADRNEHGLVFLRCNNPEHHQIGLVQSEHKKIAPPGAGLRLVHFALKVADIDMLIKARDYLRSHGIPIIFEGRHGAGAAVGLEFPDPDGYTVELIAELDQIGADGRSRPASQWMRTSTLEEAAATPMPASW